MRIDQLLQDHDHPVFSFEFFPPSSPEGERNLRDALRALAELEPDFASVTCGAGGSTRQRTLDVTRWLKADLGIEAMAHMTLVGSSVDELHATLDSLAAAGIENVLALRGDQPGGGDFQTHPLGLAHASELIALINATQRFAIGGACFPEGHPESPDRASDIANLKSKLTAGASFLITQMFFSNPLYFEFVDACHAAGLDVPILPGIMPVTSAAQLHNIRTKGWAQLPSDLTADLDRCATDADVAEVGIEYATQQCSELLAGGAPGVHFYTLNRSPATRTILARLR